MGAEVDQAENRTQLEATSDIVDALLEVPSIHFILSLSLFIS